MNVRYEAGQSKVCRPWEPRPKADRNSNYALRDAFKATATGRSMAYEARSSIVGDRIHAMKELANSVLVRGLNRWDLFSEAKGTIRELGIKGGNDYNKVMKLLNFALADESAWKELVAILAPLAEKRHQEIGTRIQSLKELVIRTYGWDTAKSVRERVYKLSREGGEAYNKMVAAVKYAPTSRKAWDEALVSLIPPKAVAVVTQVQSK